MKKQNKKSNIRNIVFAIIAVAIVAAIVGGGTYAWWIWQSADNQKTNVTVTISKPDFKIVADTISSTALMPTASCYNTPATNHVQHTMAGKATVTAKNNTTVPMEARITLKAKVSASIGSTAPAKVHWAIKEVTSTNASTFSSENCTGTANTATYDTGTFNQLGANSNANVSTSFQDIKTDIKFTVNPSSTATTKYYQVYVWVDSSYTATNTGSTVSDALQNKTFTITFSESSEFTQDIS